MKTIRFLILRMFLLFAFFAMYLYGQDRGQVIPIVRNVAWNDLIAQIDPTVDEPAKETLGKELIRIQNFLREHQSDVNVGVYDRFQNHRPCSRPLAESRQGPGNDQERIVLQGRASKAREIIHET